MGGVRKKRGKHLLEGKKEHALSLLLSCPGWEGGKKRGVFRKKKGKRGGFTTEPQVRERDRVPYPRQKEVI